MGSLEKCDRCGGRFPAVYCYPPQGANKSLNLCKRCLEEAQAERRRQLENAVSSDPYNEEILEQLASVYSQLKNRVEQARIIAQLREAKRRRLLEAAREEKRRLEEAQAERRRLENAVSSDPYNVEILEQLASVYSQLDKRDEEAEILARLEKAKIPWLEKAVENDPQNPDLYFRLGELLIPDLSYRGNYSSSEIEKTCDAFLKAVALGLSNPISRGRAYYRLGVLKEMTPTQDLTPLGKKYLNNAIREFRLALSSNPDNVEILEHLVLVYSHQQLGKPDELAEIQARLDEAKVRKKLGSTLSSVGSHTNRSEKGISFEQKCLKLIQSMGFRAHSTKNAADGGIDIIAFSNQPLVAGKYVVQCKNWSKPVGEPIVRDLYGVVAAENANNGILISSSGFTSSAISFAVGKRLQLIDGNQLNQLSLSHQGKEVD